MISHLGSVQHAKASGGSLGGQPELEKPLLIERTEWSKKRLPAILGIKPAQYPGDACIRDYHSLFWGTTEQAQHRWGT
jgi:hypothetical protein